MQRIRFDPLAGPPSLPSSLQTMVFDGQALNTRYYLLQFTERVEDRHVAAVRALAVEPLEYLPQATFLARIPPDRVDLARSVPFVRWIGPYQPAFRVGENLDAYLQSDEEISAQVRVLAGEGFDRVAASARALGAQLLLKSTQPDEGGFMRLKAKGRTMQKVAFIDGVAWIERYAEGKP